MRIYYCGKEECAGGHSFGPAVRTHYLIHFVLSGRGIYKTEDGVFEVRGGEAFLICPEQVTYYKADEEEPWSYAWVAFDGEEAEELLKNYYPDRHFPVCSVGDLSEVSRYFESLLSAFGNTEENRERVLGYFYLIMGNLVRTGEDGGVVDEEGYYNRALSFIRHNFSYQIQIQEVADYVGIDRTYLYRIFIRQTGESPKQYLSRYRLNEAKTMLYHTEYRITEVAYSCGYHDSSSFCKYFQKKVGMSPVEYRKMRKMQDGG